MLRTLAHARTAELFRHRRQANHTTAPPLCRLLFSFFRHGCPFISQNPRKKNALACNLLFYIALRSFFQAVRQLVNFLVQSSLKKIRLPVLQLAVPAIAASTRNLPMVLQAKAFFSPHAPHK